MARWTVEYHLYSGEIVYPSGPYDPAGQEAEGYTTDKSAAFTWSSREEADANDLDCAPFVVGADPWLTRFARIVEV